ncbi:MAG: hypothetical protein M3N54_03015 [Acidobacteriota bacterium]|nr:hypothetical protein [Acidobacteriota bacterium]
MRNFSYLSLTALACIAVTPTGAFAHSYGPLARLTAGPGDNARACTSCHTGTLNSGAGSVKISLLSGPVYIPGVKQRVTLQVADPNQQRWGFEFSARLNSDLQNGQAGQMVPVDNMTQVICEDNAPEPCSSGVSFIEHTSAGTRKGTKGGASFQFDWIPPATNAGPVTFYAVGNAANGDSNLTGDQIYSTSVQLTPAIPAAPSVPAGNIVSAATFAAGPVAPNSWVAIFGSNLGVTTRSWDSSDFINGGMPTSLDGVSVILTAFGAPRRAYVGYVSPTQVNILLPSDTNSTTVQVQVRNSAGLSTQLPITVQASAPQLLTLGGKFVFAVHADGNLVGTSGSSTPASPGETILLYCTGCGATSPALTPGQTPAQGFSVATLPTVTIGGASATVTSAVVLPANPGTCQISIQVPAGSANGELPVVVQLGTFTSSTTLLSVQK